MDIEQKLKTAFLKECRNKQKGEALWKVLTRRKFVSELVQDIELCGKPLDEAAEALLATSKACEEELKEDAAELVGFLRGSTGRTTPSAEATFKDVVPLTQSECSCAEIVGDKLSCDVARLPAVQAFRDQLPAPALLTDSQAHRFVIHPAVAPAKRAALEGINILTDEVHLAWTEERHDAHGWRGCCALRLGPSGEEIVITAAADWPVGVAGLALPWRRREGWRGDVPYWPRSVLHDLHLIAVEVAQRFPVTVTDAVWLVLTGETFDRMVPVQVTTETLGGAEFNRGLITITADDRVSAETVAKTYRQFQDGMQRKRESKLPTAAGCEVFTFVESRRAAGHDRNWRALAEMWNKDTEAWNERVDGWNEAIRQGNEEYPTALPEPERRRRHVYKTETGQTNEKDFSETYRRVARALLQPDHNPCSCGRDPSLDVEPASDEPVRRVRWAPW